MRGAANNEMEYLRTIRGRNSEDAIWLASWGGVWKRSGATINTFAMPIGSREPNRTPER